MYDQCMKASRQRMSVSVDANLARAATLAVKQGEAPTISAWVNDALSLKLEQERRLRALAAFIAGYENRHGAISPDEIARATRQARDRAVPVRARRRGR